MVVWRFGVDGGWDERRLTCLKYLLESFSPGPYVHSVAYVGAVR